jgi:hypothetical protein
MKPMTDRRFVLAALTFALVAGCSGKGAPAATPPSSASFAAELASTDLISGTPQDLEIGLFHSDQTTGVQLVTFGQIAIQLEYQATANSALQPGPAVTGTYLPAPGTTQTGPAPTLSDPGTARGVYLARGVTFARPGLWTASVSANIQAVGPITAAVTTFYVTKTHALPAPGDRVVGKLDVANHVMGEKGVPPSAIDSRALDGAPIPDPELHRWTIKNAVAQHRPILIVFATPTYCISQFCGPTTDAIAALAKQYATRAVFIHIEIYHSYDLQKQKGVINEAAYDWLYRNHDLTEPWIYLVGADGIIQHRWGPLFDPTEVAKDLAALPPMKA